MVYALDLTDHNINPLAKFGNLAIILNIIIPLLIIGAAIILLFVLIWGAFLILTAGGNPEKIKSAKQLFTFAIIGFIIVISSLIIVKLIGTILKINLPF